MGVHNGGITFNIITGRLKVMEHLEMKCGSTTLQAFKKMYNVRTVKDELAAELITRKARQKRELHDPKYAIGCCKIFISHVSYFSL